jgi:bifunctional DNA-binding transcriptional regulator/antitoxin component of YhaV-PrlF toxin-antitoxin module
MVIAHSKLSAQCHISVPATVRRKLGVGPGSVLEWESDDGRIVVRRAGRFTSEDVHRILFARVLKRRTLRELKQGLRRQVRARNGRR